jgi:hypothetical protein
MDVVADLATSCFEVDGDVGIHSTLSKPLGLSCERLSKYHRHPVMKSTQWREIAIRCVGVSTYEPDQVVSEPEAVTHINCTARRSLAHRSWCCIWYAFDWLDPGGVSILSR